MHCFFMTMLWPIHQQLFVIFLNEKRLLFYPPDIDPCGFFLFPKLKKNPCSMEISANTHAGVRCYSVPTAYTYAINRHTLTPSGNKFIASWTILCSGGYVVVDSLFIVVPLFMRVLCLVIVLFFGI